MTDKELRAKVAADPETQAAIGDERKFREHVIVQLAVLDQRANSDKCDIQDLEKVVFGDDGRTGLVGDVIRLQKDQGLWTRSLAIAQGLITLALLYMGFKQ